MKIRSLTVSQRPGNPYGGDKVMAEDKLTIRLTDDQKKQLQQATGKKVTALNIDLMGGPALPG